MYVGQKSSSLDADEAWDGTGAGDGMLDESVDERSWARAESLRGSSDLNDKLGVGVGEALELVLVQVHDEEFVCRRQLHRHLGELLVKVANVAARLLSQREQRESDNRERKETFSLLRVK